MDFRLGKFSLRASLRKISSARSYDVSAALFTAAPPRPQLLPVQGQLSSFWASSSLQSAPLAGQRGEITMVPWSAYARRAEAGNEANRFSSLRAPLRTAMIARVIHSFRL